MTTWKIHTEAVTRSKSRMSRDWVITADSLDDAIDEAAELHREVCGWNTTVWHTTHEQVASELSRHDISGRQRVTFASLADWDRHYNAGR